MSKKCDRCGKVMRRAAYDTEHATIHLGMCGIDPRMGEYRGDVWYLLCPECIEKWREKFREWLKGDVG